VKEKRRRRSPGPVRAQEFVLKSSESGS